MAKLSISIPDELKERIDERAEADQVPVSHVISQALRTFFELPDVPKPVPQTVPPELSEQLQAIQAYLWELHFSHECTRSAALNLYYWASRNGQTLGMPPEAETPKPPWMKSEPPMPEAPEKNAVRNSRSSKKPR